MNNIDPEVFRGVWSAAPTPFLDDMEVDVSSIGRLVEHHIRLGIKGLFVAGSCGEGPWMTTLQRRQVLQATVAAVAGRMPVAFQVTDNSAARILDNIAMAQEDGADLAVIASPYFLRNASPANLKLLYRQATENSPLPVIVYDVGRHAPISIPAEILGEVYLLDNVVAVKDSSGDPARAKIALAARDSKPGLRLLDGDEFRCDEYLEAGYDGLMLGGAAFNGYLAGLILQTHRNGDKAKAKQLQKRMNDIMYAVYGGETIEWWLAGVKQLLMSMGIFKTYKNYLNYTLDEAGEKIILDVLLREADVLVPVSQG